MAYLPSAQSSPYAGMQFVSTAPDLGGLANVVGGLANTFQESRRADADRALEMYRIQTESNQQTANNMLGYLQELRKNRYQESQQAMEMLKLSSEMKEINYRLEQTRKMDDAKWQARDARAQLFPLLSQIESRTQENDLWGASQLIKQGFSIPGVTDDETSLKFLTEYNARLNSFKIDDKPAIQVLNALKSEAIANHGSGSWDKLRDALKRVSAGSNLDEVSKQLAADMGARPGQFAKIKSFLEKGSNVTEPEEAARLKEQELALRSAYMNTIMQNMGNPDFDADAAADQFYEARERVRQIDKYGKYSPFQSSEHPTMDYMSFKNLVQPVQRTLAQNKQMLQDIADNASTRAAFLGAKPLDAETAKRLQKKNPQAYVAFQQLMAQRKPATADVIDGKKLKEFGQPSEMRDRFTGEMGLLSKLEADLSATTSSILGIMAKIENDPKSTQEEDLALLNRYAEQLDSLLTPYYGPGSVSMDIMNPYASKQMQRYIQNNKRQRQRLDRMMGGGAGNMVTIPSTPAAGGSIPFPTAE